MDKKEQTRLRVQRYREKRALPNSVTLSTPEALRDSVTEKENGNANVTQYPALLHALADPVKRAKLRRICEELKNHGQLRNVYYGAGETSVPFDVVSEYIEVLT